MTHKERLITALERGVPDVVPVTWEMEMRFAQKLSAQPGWRAICEAHRILGSAIFNVQGIGPRIVCHPKPGYSRESWEESAPGGGRFVHQRLQTPQGSLHAVDLVGYMPHDPLVSKHTEYLIKQRSDWEIYADYITEMARTAEPDISESLAAYDEIADDGLVGGWMADTVYHLAHLRKDTDYILDLVEAPDFMEDIMRAVDPYTKAHIQAFNASKIECLVYDICWASLSLLSPELVRRFVIPRARRAVELVAPGKYIVFFQTGRIRAVVPDLVACRPHGIQHFDVLGDCDLAEIKRSFGRDICIIGNLNPVILSHGSVAEARAEARRCLEAAKEGGGYIMSTSDELPADAKIENLKAIVEYVAQEGRYRS